MIRFIYKTSSYEKSITELKEKGGISSEVAKKAENAVRRILKTNNISSKRLTKYGENRIKHAIKFDLGNGYRLICMIQRHTLSLLYIGTHDECNRWLEKNKGLKIMPDGNLNSVEYNEKRHSESKIIYEELMLIRKSAEDYENKLISEIDQQLLNNILSGWFRQ